MSLPLRSFNLTDFLNSDQFNVICIIILIAKYFFLSRRTARHLNLVFVVHDILVFLILSHPEFGFLHFIKILHHLGLIIIAFQFRNSSY